MYEYYYVTQDIEQDPQHLVKIAHALGFAKISDIDVEFGDDLDNALIALDTEITNMQKEQKQYGLI